MSVVLLNGSVLPYLKEQLEESFEVIQGQPASLEGLSEADLSRICAVVSPAEYKVTAQMMDKLPNLAIISNFGVGYDNIDTKAAVERSIWVTNTPGVLSADVADLTLGLMLALARKIPQSERYLREGSWESGLYHLCSKVSGKKAGIVGLGRIGLEIVKRLKAFDMQVKFFGHHDVEGLERVDSIETLAAWCDYLILCIPGRPENHKLIDAKILKALGPQGRLINIARGSVVDEEALIEALEQGSIAGAALDVFVTEPYVNERLKKLSENTVLTPHIGTLTVETRHEMSDLIVNNIKAYAEGRELLSPVPECEVLYLESADKA